MSAEASAGRRRLYFDTSAYLCVLLGEAGSERLSAATEGAELLSSVLMVLEARRNLIRLAREGALKPAHYKVCMERVEADTERFELRDVTLDFCRAAPVPAIATPRSLDLAHLRTALWFHAAEPVDRFVTLDTAQAEAAQEMGLPL